MKKILLVSFVFLMCSFLVFSEGQKDDTAGRSFTADEDFDWRRFEGTELKLLGCAGPYNTELQEAIDSFSDITGITVTADFLPESDYFNKVQLVSAAHSGEYDLYMIGFPNMIDWVPAGWIEPLDEYIKNPALLDPDFNIDDFYPAMLDNCCWDGVNGHKFGSNPNSKLWALPLGVMINQLMYRKDIFEKYGLEVPRTVKDAIRVGEIIQEKEPGMYGIGTRGIKEMQMLYGGVWTTLRSYGANDFNSSLEPEFNSKDMVRGLLEWKEMIEKIGNYKNWANMTWYDVMNDFQNGHCAMILDACAIGGWINTGDPVPAKGLIAFAPPLVEDDINDMSSLMWAWNLGMSSDCKNKDAAWYFIQYATGAKMQKEGNIMSWPTRRSVFEDADFIAANEETGNGTIFKAWEQTVPYTEFPFTPAIGFNDYGYQLAGEIQNVVLGLKSPEEAMSDLEKYYKNNFQ